MYYESGEDDLLKTAKRIGGAALGGAALGGGLLGLAGALIGAAGGYALGSGKKPSGFLQCTECGFKVK